MCAFVLMVFFVSGIYGLSNGCLGTGWKKVEAGKQRLQTVLTNVENALDSDGDGGVNIEEEMFNLLNDRTW